MPDQLESCKDIAVRLKGLREAMDLDIEGLAGRLQLSPAEVERYESGACDIPVSYLVHVGHVFGVDLTTLITGGEPRLKNHSLVRRGEGLATTRRKDYDYKSLAYRFTGRHMEPFLVTVPPKPEGQVGSYSHSGQEFIYVTKGRLEVRLGETVLVLEPGDCLYFDSHTPHGLRGLDDQPAEFLDVII